MVKFSEEQKSIINAARSNILVSAAAGSGKTTVLAQRITSKIINHELGIDELLVVTFTKDAASHMREKIESSLRKALNEEGADRKYIKSQIDKVPGAYIQTMNSFCNRVVSEAGHMSEDSDVMEPGSAVLDDTTLKILRKQSANEAVMAVYEAIAQDGVSDGEREDFLNLVFSMGDGKNEGPVAEAVDEAYLKLRSLPDYLEIIDGVIANRERTDADGIIVGLSQYIEMYDDLIRKADSACDGCGSYLDNMNLPDKYKLPVRAIIESVRRLSAEYIERFDACSDDKGRRDVIDNFFADFYNNSDPSDYKRLYTSSDNKDLHFLKIFGPIAALCVINLQSHKNAGDKVSAQWGFNDSAAPYKLNPDFDVIGTIASDDLMVLQKRRTSCARAFASLLKDMDARYSVHKKRLRGIDFSDQEHMCLRVLKTPEINNLFKNKFKEIYIDEYQDNTSLQDAVVALIANNNVFCVGDVKQSIYKFRNANPSMFIRKAELYRNDPSEGNLMGLNCNFRSTPQILAFVNEIFGQLMSGDAAEIDYEGGGHELNPSPIATDGNIPEVIIINSTDSPKVKRVIDGVETEVKVSEMELLVTEVGKKVMEYHNSGYDYKDIYVLTRTNNAARVSAEHLRSLGIPARCVDKKPLFSDNEIIGICNLLKILANEYRDECLAGVMLSCYRFSNFMLDEMAEIISFSNKDYRYMNLIIKIRNYALNGPNDVIRERCVRFIETIDDLRAESVIRDIDELMELIFAKTGIKATLMKVSPYEVDKLTVFKNWLCSNFLNRGSDITEVASVIEQMQNRLDDSAAIEYDLGGEDLVRCMNYHKSKGLENKCVIVADVDSSNETDTSGFISFKAGKVLSADNPSGPRFVVDDYDDNVSITSTSAEKAIVKEEDSLESTAEEMRLLYVALTRAEENLCFIRRINLSSKTLKQNVITPLLSEDKYLSRYFYTKCSGIANMMFAALLRMRASDDSSSLTTICGVNDTFNYVSDFEDVKIKVKTAEDIVDFSEGDQDAPHADVVPIDRSLDLPFAFDDGDESDDSGADWRGQAIYGSSGVDSAGMPEFESYRYEDSMMAPAKTSVSAMKQMEDSVYSSEKEGDLKVAINLLVPDVDNYMGEKNGISGAALGTAVHKAMSFIDLVRLSEDSSVSALGELDALAQEGILTPAEHDAVAKFADNIQAFAVSDLGRALAVADKEGRAEREKSLICALRINPDRPDYTLVQGTLDAMYIDTDGAAVIIDYKTDYLKTDDPAEITKTIKERHGAQLELYAAAVEESGIKVKARYIVLLRKNMVIEV